MHWRRASTAGYTLLLTLLSPAVLIYTGWMAFKHRDRRYLAQRLGFYWDGCASKAWWIHAASVGEVNAAIPLVEELRQHHGNHPILLTTSTPTGAEIALKRTPEGVEHAYLPVDWPGAVKRFLRRYRPRCGILIETELWPNLYAAGQREDVPLLIVNGRLSDRTLSAPRWVRNLYRGCLKGVKGVLARTEEDGARFLRLGAAPEIVHVVGNIKFAGALGRADVQPVKLPRAYVLAASTREGEEAKILGAWRAARTGSRLLVIAPRHPKRRNEILRDLKAMGATVAIRSRGDGITPDTEVYLADTFGELQRLIAGAELVFMGGSLVEKGGHNILEPAGMGKPVIFGPHMANFRDEAALLLEEKATLQVSSAEELTRSFSTLLADRQQRSFMGKRAQEVVASRTDMAIRYRKAIEQLCRYPSP